jgi:hypothetical protein
VWPSAGPAGHQAAIHPQVRQDRLGVGNDIDHPATGLRSRRAITGPRRRDQPQAAGVRRSFHDPNGDAGSRGAVVKDQRRPVGGTAATHIEEAPVRQFDLMHSVVHGPGSPSAFAYASASGSVATQATAPPVRFSAVQPASLKALAAAAERPPTWQATTIV